MFEQFLQSILLLPTNVSYLIVFIVLLACGIGIPIPEDLTLFTAGILSYEGQANVWVMVVLCIVGVLAGDTVIYFAGRKYGQRILNRPFFARILHEERMGEIHKRFHKNGNFLIFLARFMPGLRAPVYFTSGTLHLPFSVFLFYDGLATMISVPTIVYGTYHFGEKFEEFFKWIRKFEYGLLAMFVTFAIVVSVKIFYSTKEVKTIS